MKNIQRLIGGSLKWVQPSAFTMRYELRAGDEVVGAMSFRSASGSFATGECADGCWTFKRVGFFQTRVTVRQCESEVDIATFRNNTWSAGGTLELADGRRLLANTNFWQTSLQFQEASGEPLIRFDTAGMIHLSATIRIEPSAGSMEELPIIVMLGWYLIVMMHSDMAAQAAIIG